MATRIELAADVGMPQQALQLRREDHLAADPRIKQRLLACAVAREDQRVRPGVPDRQSEHAVELGDRRDAALEIERQDRLDVGLRAIRIVGIARADLRGVVDLAVALEPDLRAGRGERLVGPLVQIDDAQPLGADDGVLVLKIGVPVRPAMPQRLPHEPENLGMTQGGGTGDHAVDSAHVSRGLTRGPGRRILSFRRCRAMAGDLPDAVSRLPRAGRDPMQTAALQQGLRGAITGSHDVDAGWVDRSATTETDR